MVFCFDGDSYTRGIPAVGSFLFIPGNVRILDELSISHSEHLKK
jgi:hypothetical protein